MHRILCFITLALLMGFGVAIGTECKVEDWRYRHVPVLKDCLDRRRALRVTRVKSGFEPMTRVKERRSLLESMTPSSKGTYSRHGSAMSPRTPSKWK